MSFYFCMFPVALQVFGWNFAKHKPEIKMEFSDTFNARVIRNAAKNSFNILLFCFKVRTHVKVI